MAKTQIFSITLCFILVAISLASSAPAADKQFDSIAKTSEFIPDIKTVPSIDSEQHTDIDTSDKKAAKLNTKPVKDKDFYIQAMVQGYQSHPYPIMAGYNNFPYEHGGYGAPMQGGNYGYGYDSMGGFNMHGRNNEYGNNWY